MALYPIAGPNGSGLASVGSTSHARLHQRPIDIRAFGASTALSNNATVIQLALAEAASGGGAIYVPHGTYNTGGLTISGNETRVFGDSASYQGGSSSVLKGIAGADPLITLGTVGASQSHIVFHDINLWCPSGAGDVFKQVHGGGGEAGLFLSTFERITCRQDNAAKRIWNNNGSFYLDNVWRDFDLFHIAAGTVNPFYLNGPAGNININTWERGRVTYSGEHFFYLYNASVGTYNYDNHFKDINFEVTNGGNIKAVGAMNTVIENCNTYDLSGGGTTRNLYEFDKNTEGDPVDISSRYITFRNVQRRGGALGGGLYDIKFVSGGCHTALLEMLDSAVLTGYAVDLGSTLQVKAINCDNVTFSNPAADFVELGQSAQSVVLSPSQMILDGGTSITLGANQWAIPAVNLANGSTQGFSVSFPMPFEYTVGTPTLTIFWVPSATDAVAHTVRWSVAVDAVTAGDDITRSGGDTVVQTGASAARTVNIVVSDNAITLPVIAGYTTRMVKLNVRRVGADAADTYVGDVRVVGARVDFTGA